MNLTQKPPLPFGEGPKVRPGFLAAPEHPMLVEFTTYLTQQTGNRNIIDRSDINPADIRPFLPHLQILDVINNGEDFRVRVFGTELVNLLGEERTGFLTSQFGERSTIQSDQDELRTRWMTLLRQAYTSRRMLHFKTTAVSASRSYMHYQGSIAPVTTGSNDITQLIVMMLAVIEKTS